MSEMVQRHFLLGLSPGRKGRTNNREVCRRPAAEKTKPGKSEDGGGYDVPPAPSTGKMPEKRLLRVEPATNSTAATTTLPDRCGATTPVATRGSLAVGEGGDPKTGGEVGAKIHLVKDGRS